MDWQLLTPYKQLRGLTVRSDVSDQNYDPDDVISVIAGYFAVVRGMRSTKCQGDKLIGSF